MGFRQPLGCRGFLVAVSALLAAACGGRSAGLDAGSGASGTSGAGGLAGAAAGASGAVAEPDPSLPPPTGPFAVSDYFEPVGLGDGADPNNLEIDVNRSCKARPPGAVGDCYRFIAGYAAELWTGAWWLLPSARHEALPIAGSALRRVTFWAAVEHAPQKYSFTIGGFDGALSDPPTLGRDLLNTRTETTLTREWQQIGIDLPSPEQQLHQGPITTLASALTWSTNAQLSPTDLGDSPQTLYIDGIVYE